MVHSSLFIVFINASTMYYYLLPITYELLPIFMLMEPLKEEINIELPQPEPVKEKASRLRFAFRFAFICNIFFIVCMILRYTTLPKYLPQPIIEFSIILGWPAILINLINFILALILISRIRRRQIPLWLLYANIICFILEIYFFFILHD